MLALTSNLLCTLLSKKPNQINFTCENCGQVAPAENLTVCSKPFKVNYFPAWKRRFLKTFLLLAQTVRDFWGNFHEIFVSLPQEVKSFHHLGNDMLYK